MYDISLLEAKGNYRWSERRRASVGLGQEKLSSFFVGELHAEVHGAIGTHGKS